MMWDYWICLYTQTHCVARGLRPLTIAAYLAALRQFEAYVTVRLAARGPDQMTAKEVLEYLEYLRRERNNGDSAINRTATILKNFYRAIVAMGHLAPAANPLAQFPRIRAQIATSGLYSLKVCLPTRCGFSCRQVGSYAIPIRDGMGRRVRSITWMSMGRKLNSHPPAVRSSMVRV